MLGIESHDPCIAAVNHVRRLNGEDELLQEDLRRLVAAVLRPGLPEALELDVGRVATLPSEMVADAFHLVDAEGESKILANRSKVCI